LCTSGLREGKGGTNKMGLKGIQEKGGKEIKVRMLKEIGFPLNFQLVLH
jgi:hypothetical protein